MRPTLLIAVLVATPSLAAPAGYAQATGYFKKDSRPTLYQPLNLLDGRNNTAWCTASADALSDQLTVGFKGDTRIEEIRITTGNNFDDATFKDFGRAQKLEIKGLHDGRRFTVADLRGPQSVTFNPPLEGARFTLEILDTYPGEDPDSPTCITDLVFVSEGKPLNGSWMSPKLKYDRNTQPLLGTWFGGYEGAADRFLSFFYDGTFRYSFEPFDTNRYKPKEFGGGFDATPSRLTLDLPGKGKVGVKLVRGKSKGGADTITLDGDVPDDLKGAFRAAP